MSKTAHAFYIGFMVIIVILAGITFIYIGTSYYATSLEERFYHSAHKLLKPSGIWGHGIGIGGSLFMIIGILSYMLRKRLRIFSRLGVLKHWLEFHIFLCTLGPIMILFHTAFKFGGIVAISFWSMVAVFLSGIIGRYIYIQIPRSIEGRELSLNEISGLKNNIGDILKNQYNLTEESHTIITNSIKRKIEVIKHNALIRFFNKYIDDKRNLRNVKAILKQNKLNKSESRKIVRLVNNEISINRRIDRLTTMQNLFKYWHVAHLPFALIMLIIMLIHIAITILFGYKWIF